MDKIKIALADYHQLFRNGLKILLGNYNEFEVVAEASNGNELLRALETCPSDIVLMDISMPEMDGVEATGVLSRQMPGTKVIALSMYGEEEYTTEWSTQAQGALSLKTLILPTCMTRSLQYIKVAITSRRNCS